MTIQYYVHIRYYAFLKYLNTIKFKLLSFNIIKIEFETLKLILINTMFNIFVVRDLFYSIFLFYCNTVLSILILNFR